MLYHNAEARARTSVRGPKMHDSLDVETHSLRSEGRMFVAFACLTRKKAMKRKTEEEYSMNSTGEY